MGSPEYTAAVDMWAVGCIFAEMLCLNQPFQGYSEIEILKQIFSKLGGWPLEESWPGVTSLPDYPHPKLPFEEPVKVSFWYFFSIHHLVFTHLHTLLIHETYVASAGYRREFSWPWGQLLRPFEKAALP